MGAVELISLYDTLFKVSLFIALLGFGLAIFFFFYFDIRTVYELMTGKAKQDTVRRMAEQNAKTGNLRNQFAFTGPMTKGKTGKTGRRGMTDTLTQEIHHTIQQPAEAETTYLSDEPQMNTTVLANDDQMNTTVLAEENFQSAMTQTLSAPVGQFRFMMTENTLVIHTDEII